LPCEIDPILNLPILINMFSLKELNKKNTFHKVKVWKMSRELVNLIYCDFRKCRDFSFKDQASRAGISIMNNISDPVK